FFSRRSAQPPDLWPGADDRLRRHTNQSFLMACLRHPVFAKGAANTGFIGVHRDELVGGDVREEAPVEGVASSAALAALLLAVTHPLARSWRGGRTLAAAFPIPLRLDIAGKVHEAELLHLREGGYRVNEGGHEHGFALEQLTVDTVRFQNGAIIESAE